MDKRSTLRDVLETGHSSCSMIRTAQRNSQILVGGDPFPKKIHVSCVEKRVFFPKSFSLIPTLFSLPPPPSLVFQHLVSLFSLSPSISPGRSLMRFVQNAKKPAC